MAVIQSNGISLQCNQTFGIALLHRSLIFIMALTCRLVVDANFARVKVTEGSTAFE